MILAAEQLAATDVSEVATEQQRIFYWLIIYRVTNVLILVADQLAATDVSEGATKKKQTRGLCHLVLILLILKNPVLIQTTYMYTVCCSLYVL